MEKTCMHLLFYLLLLGSPDKMVTYDPSGIYDRHITRWFAAVSPEGDLYVLNPNEGHVNRFTPDGRNAGLVGGKGQGPGEYNRPERIFFNDNQLFIVDQGGTFILSYDREGNYSKRFTTPVGMILERVSGGWAYANWRMATREEEPIRVFWGDNYLTKEKELLNWPRGKAQVETRYKRKPGEQLKTPFNPVPDFPKMVTTFSGEYLYLYEPGKKLRIHIANLTTKKVVNLINTKIKQAPFDKAWAEGIMKEAVKRNQERGHNIGHYADFPDFFPPVSMLAVNESGNLVIGRMVGGEQPMEYLAFDHNGNQITGDAGCPLQYTYRILAVHGGDAWVSLVEEDQAIVSRVPVSELKTLFEREEQAVLR